MEAQSAVLRLETTTTTRGGAVGCDKVEGDDVGMAPVVVRGGAVGFLLSR